MYERENERGSERGSEIPEIRPFEIEIAFLLPPSTKNKTEAVEASLPLPKQNATLHLTRLAEAGIECPTYPTRLACFGCRAAAALVAAREKKREKSRMDLRFFAKKKKMDRKGIFMSPLDPSLSQRSLCRSLASCPRSLRLATTVVATESACCCAGTLLARN